MKNQVQWQNKTYKITSFRIVKSKINKRAIILQLKQQNRYRNWVTVSWVAGCCDSKYKRDPLRSALRYAILYQIYKWKKDNSTPDLRSCQYCSSLSSLQVDHDSPSFKDMVKEFLIQIPTSMVVPSLFDFHSAGRKFRQSELAFRNKWCNYHAKHARLQWLCGPCNLKKSCN